MHKYYLRNLWFFCKNSFAKTRNEAKSRLRRDAKVAIRTWAGRNFNWKKSCILNIQAPIVFRPPACQLKRNMSTSRYSTGRVHLVDASSFGVLDKFRIFNAAFHNPPAAHSQKHTVDPYKTRRNMRGPPADSDDRSRLINKPFCIRVARLNSPFSTRRRRRWRRASERGIGEEGTAGRERNVGVFPNRLFSPPQIIRRLRKYGSTPARTPRIW